MCSTAIKLASNFWHSLMKMNSIDSLQVCVGVLPPLPPLLLLLPLGEKKADRQTNGLKNKHSWLISWPRWAVKSVKHKHCAQCGLSGPIIGSVLCCFRWHIGKVKKKGETTEGASFTFLESDQLRTTGVGLITANWRWVQRQQVALLLHCLAQEGTSRPNYRLLVTFPGKPTLVASRDAIN